MDPRHSNRDEYPPRDKRRRYETEAGKDIPTRTIESSSMHQSNRSESVVVLDSDGDQQEYSGSRSKHKGTRDRSRSRFRDRSIARYRSRSRERHRGSRYHSKVRDRDRDRGRKRDRSRRRRRDYDSSDSESDHGRYRTRDYDRDILFTSEEDLDPTDEDERDQVKARPKIVRARSRSQGRLQSRQIISMGPPLNHVMPQVDDKAFKRMKEEQEAFAQQVVERDGIAIWRAWCLDQKFEDGDWITPDKLTAYVDCEITSRERSVVPTQSVVGSFVRPVLRLWGDQAAGQSSGATSDADAVQLQAFLKQIQTLAKSSSIDLSASDSTSGVDKMGESTISNLKRAQQDAKAKGITGMLVDPLLVGLVQDQYHLIQALVASVSHAPSGPRPTMTAPAPSPSHHHMSPSPAAARPTARSKRHPSQKNKAARFQADKIVVPVWYGKGRFTKLKPGRIYPLNPDVQTVQDVLTEWLEGIDGAPSIQELNTKYRAQWRDTDPTAQRLLQTRSCIVREFRRLVLEGGKTEKDALELMENAASGKTLRCYADKIRAASSQRKQNLELVKAFQGKGVPARITAGPPRGGNKNYKLDEGDESGEDNASASSDAEESDKSFGESAMTDSTAGGAPGRSTAQIGLRDAQRSTATRTKMHGFPFPVNNLENVRDIWQEWYKGWNGSPSLERLIEQHGRVFYRKPFTRYRHMFYAKQKIVRMLDQLIKDRNLTEEEAIEKMEYHREGRSPRSLAATLEHIDWTKPLPSNYGRNSTLQQQEQQQQLQVDAEEELQHQDQQVQLRHEHPAMDDQHQVPQQQHQLQDDSHRDGVSFQGFHDERDDHSAFTDMARMDRSDNDFSIEPVAEPNAVSDSARSFEQDSLLSPSRPFYAERSELHAVSDTSRSYEQDHVMSPPIIDQLTATEPGYQRL